VGELRWWRQRSRFGAVAVVVGAAGVVRLELPAWEFVPPDGKRERDAEIACELAEYLTGERQEFSIPVDLSLVEAPFRRKVLGALSNEVPYGETATYGELAVIVGHPGAARAVGTALAHNPVALLVPCHRVVASNGIGGYGRQAGGGVALKRALLDLELRGSARASR
jgi:methylated-DNA-[protein]-cysteine S-methyltransferase